MDLMIRFNKTNKKNKISNFMTNKNHNNKNFQVLSQVEKPSCVT